MSTFNTDHFNIDSKPMLKLSFKIDVKVFLFNSDSI